jgi:hypothetical protein
MMIQKSGATPESIQRFKKWAIQVMFWVVESLPESPLNPSSESPLNLDV